MSTMTTIQKFFATLPRTWFSDTAKSEGGILYAVVAALCKGLDYIESGATYVRNQTRVSTATGDNLDKISADFFGDGLQRRSGESDDGFRNRILGALFQEKGTKVAVINAVEALGAEVVECYEPVPNGFYTDYCHTNRNRISGDDPYEAILFIRRPLGPAVTGLMYTDFGCTDRNYVPDVGANIWQITDEDIYDAIEKTKVCGTRVWAVLDPIPMSEASGDNRTSAERYYIP